MAKIDVTMPKMGESITEGTVIVWLKKPGEAVAMDEPLLEIGTDKVDTEVPSPAEGVLAEILVQEGDTVDVGSVIARLETEADASAGGSETPSEPAQEAKKEEPQAPEPKAEPAAEEAAPESKAEPAAEEAAPESRAKPATEEAAAESKAKPAAEEAAPESNPAGQSASAPAAAASPEKKRSGDVATMAAGEPVEVVMPKMGESIMEGTIISWAKKPGDRIELDETLLEIATDKVDTEVPSPAAGIVVQLLAEEGATVDVGAPIAIIATGATSAEATAPSGAGAPSGSAAPSETAAPSGSAAPSGAAEAPQETQAGVPVAPAQSVSGDGQTGPIPRHDDDGRFYSPLVRSIAETEGISLGELKQIEGSGRDGRLTKSDVMGYLENRKQSGVSAPAAAPGAPAQAAEAPAAPARAAEAPAAPTPSRPAPSPVVASEDGRVEIIQMDRMRQIIAEHMVRSKATSAHVTSFAEIDVTNLVRLREEQKDAFLKREGVKLTYTPFFVHAAIDALKDHPLMNGSVQGKEIVVKKDFHIGIAVAIGNTGLVAPVMRYAGQKNVAGLAHSAADLAARARSKQLQPDELQGGTFTVTNVGSLGSIMGTPIINQPQVAILATGAIKKRPVVIEDPNLGDVIGIRQMMFVSLSYDHRIIDGAMAASFLHRYREALEAFAPGYEL